MSRCKRLATEQEFVAAPNLVPPSDEDSIDEIEGYFSTDSEEGDPIFTDLEFSGLQDSDFFDMLECYVNLPEDSLAGQNPLKFKNIADKQKDDNKLRTLKQKLPNQYIDKLLDADSRDVTCYVKEHDNPDTQWRIYLPDSILLKSVSSMDTSNLGTPRIFEAVQNNVTTFLQQVAVCNTLLTPLSATIVKNTSYLEKGTVSCQTGMLYLNLEVKMPWIS